MTSSLSHSAEEGSAGEKKNKEFAAKIDNLESQVQDLTHLVARLLKSQSPTSSTQVPNASPQAKEKPSHSGEPTEESSNAYSKPPDPPFFPTKTRRESKSYSRKVEKEKRAFAP